MTNKIWKILTPDKGKLRFLAPYCLVISVVLVIIYFDKPRIKSKADITFISGPFQEYSWISHGGRGGSSLTFKLQTYSNKFKIPADFFSILEQDRFKAIPYGDTLVIGIPNSFVKHLNTAKNRFFVYSIASNRFTYLDLNDAIAKHNSKLLLYTSGLFLLSGLIIIYFLKRKNQTPERFIHQ
jgi:hypothetical protein